MADNLNVRVGLAATAVRLPSSNQESQVIHNAGPGNAVLFPATLPPALAGLFGVPFPAGSELRTFKNGGAIWAAAVPGTFLVAPAVPASTSPQSNTTGQPVAVNVIGGTVTAVAVNGVTQTVDGVNIVGGMFIVPSGGTITLTYSVAPTWTWQAGAPTVIQVQAGIAAT